MDEPFFPDANKPQHGTSVGGKYGRESASEGVGTPEEATEAAVAAGAAMAWAESERVRRLDQALALACAGNVDLGTGLSAGGGCEGGMLFLGRGSSSADSQSLGTLGRSREGGQGGSRGGAVGGLSPTRNRRKVRCSYGMRLPGSMSFGGCPSRRFSNAGHGWSAWTRIES